MDGGEQLHLGMSRGILSENNSHVTNNDNHLLGRRGMLEANRRMTAGKFDIEIMTPEKRAALKLTSSNFFVINVNAL